MSDQRPPDYAHFAQRLAERCPYDVGDPYAFAAAVHAAVKAGDETVALRVKANAGTPGTAIYRIFHEGTPVGYAVIGETSNHWPMTYYSPENYRAKRYAQKQVRRGKKNPVRPGLGVDGRVARR